MVLIFLTMFVFFDASRIGVVVVGPPISCVSKTFFDVFLLLLDCISFVTCPSVNVNLAVDKIGTTFFFLIGLSLHLFDCVYFVLWLCTAPSPSKT